MITYRDNARVDPNKLVEQLNFAQKVERSETLIREAFEAHGHGLVVAHSLGKDSAVVWHLAKRVAAQIRGFIVTTRYKPVETVTYMYQQVEKYPELRIFKNDSPMPAALYDSNPDLCCSMLKVEPAREALREMGASCWVTGLRCTEGRTRTDYREVENRDQNLEKLNPILIWHEREVWQYLALHSIAVNPLYAEGYRSLGCAPCTRVTAGGEERAGRWVGSSKCGGECGIHTRPMVEPQRLIRARKVDLS